MNIHKVSARMLLLPTVLLLVSVPGFKAHSGTAAALAKDEYKAVQFGRGSSEKENTKLLNDLAAEGWEYVGPLAEGRVAFRRRPVSLQRLRIVGKWQLVGEKKKTTTIEFLRDGKIKLGGDVQPLTELFKNFKIVIELKGDPEAFSYDIPEEGRCQISILDSRKLNVKLDDLQRAFPGFQGYPYILPNRARIVVSDGALTMSVSRDLNPPVTQSFKRIK